MQNLQISKNSSTNLYLFLILYVVLIEQKVKSFFLEIQWFKKIYLYILNL